MFNEIASFFRPAIIACFGEVDVPTVTISASRYRFLAFFMQAFAFITFAKWMLAFPVVSAIFAALSMFFGLVALSNWLSLIVREGLFSSSKIVYNRVSNEPLTPDPIVIRADSTVHLVSESGSSTSTTVS